MLVWITTKVLLQLISKLVTFITAITYLGAIFILIKGIGVWVGGPEKGNFPLLYVVKMSLTALDWLRQEELQEVPPKNGYFQIDHWI